MMAWRNFCQSVLPELRPYKRLQTPILQVQVFANPCILEAPRLSLETLRHVCSVKSGELEASRLAP